MSTYEQLTIEQLEEAAAFIATLNTNKEFHIGYCGTVKKDILSDLQVDFIVNDLATIFVARHNGEISALIGFDIEEEIAEVWGPFSIEQQIETQLKLWEYAKEILPQLTNFLFFINEENTFQQQVMHALQAKKSSEHLYLVLSKETFQQIETIKSKPFSIKDFTQFEAIHNAAFPNTYYSAKTIIENITNAHHQLIVLKEAQIVKGYAYFEIDETLQSTHLEYFTIASEFRGQGLGKMLLNEALTLIFTNSAIEQVTLTVNNNNNVANSLYYKTGFKKQDVLWSYILNI